MKKWWPALVAIALVVIAYILWSGREQPAARTTPVERAAVPVAAPALPAQASTGSAQLQPPPPLGDVHPLAHPTAVKGEMTLDEKLAETQKHVDVMERRASILEREIGELERQGKTREAAEQRVVLQRLRAHAAELRTAITEKREPQ